jgi:uncharacterized protein involved in type VI secretion and phage assembly
MIALNDLMIKIGETKYIDLTEQNTVTLFETYKFIYKSAISGECEMILMFTDLEKEVNVERDDFIGKFVEITFKTLGEETVNKNKGYDVKYSGIITDFYFSDNYYSRASNSGVTDKYNSTKLRNIDYEKLYEDEDLEIKEIYTIVIKPDFFHERGKQNKIYIEKSSLDIAKELINDFPKLEIDTNSTPDVPIRDFCLHYQVETNLDFFQRILSEDGLSYIFVFDHECDKTIICIYDNGTRDKGNDINIENKSPIAVETSHHDQIKKINIYDHAIDNPDNEVSCVKATTDRASREINELSLSQHLDGGYETKEKTIDVLGGMYIKFESLNASEYKLMFENIEEIFMMHPGRLLTLKRNEEDKEFMIKSVNMEYQFYKSREDAVLMSIIAVDPAFDFVPEIIQPPFIPLMSARVIGNENEKERYYKKDEDSHYDSVKVKFHWDTDNIEQQYWLRVVQIMAGKNYGSFFRPIVNSEVIVSFLYGPNVAPVVLGCLHDGKTKFPSWLNAKNETVKKAEEDKRLNKFSSGIITRNEENEEALYTELIFDDTMDGEKFSINTAKDYESTIQNDRDIYLMEGNDSLTIKKGDETITLEEGTRKLDIKKGDEYLDIAEGARTLNINKGDVSMTLGEGSRTMNIDKGDNTITIGEGSRILDIKKGDESITLGEGSRSLTITKGDELINLGKGTHTVKAKKQIFEADDEITLKCGGSQIVLKPTGIEIKSPSITLKAAKTLEAQSAKTTIKGTAMVEISGAMTKIMGSGMLECLGGLVKIN